MVKVVTMMEESADPASLVVSEPPLPTEPLSYLCPDKMITRSLSEWHKAITIHQDELSDWFVIKLQHCKSFHFSSVVHEFLKFTVQKRNTQEIKELFVERMVHDDEVTVGWKWVQHPKLSGWWIIRLLRGYFGDARGGAIPVLASSSSVTHWKAIGYSASDYLCHLQFDEPGIPLLEFADVLVSSSKSAPKYGVTAANCFWFAFTVYETLKEKRPCSEHRGGYFKHRGKFAGLSILPFNLFSTNTAAKDIERAKKRAEQRQALKEE